MIYEHTIIQLSNVKQRIQRNSLLWNDTELESKDVHEKRTSQKNPTSAQQIPWEKKDSYRGFY